jgi:hypothetical protein
VLAPPRCTASERFDATPRRHERVCVVASVRIDEVGAVVDSAVRVPQRIEIAVRTSAITDDRSAGFDPVTYDSRLCVSGSVRYGNIECFAPFYLTHGT